jgi:hypothetical protein
MQAIRIFLVSAYLLGVAIWLLGTREVAAPGLGKVLRAMLRRPFGGELSDFRSEDNNCWLASVPEWLLSDREAASRLRLYEDGRPLGPAHSAHSDIRSLGQGRFSHWGPTVYFSTSDNSDPRTNGRRYSVSE